MNPNTIGTAAGLLASSVDPCLPHTAFSIRAALLGGLPINPQYNVDPELRWRDSGEPLAWRRAGFGSLDTRSVGLMELQGDTASSVW